MQWRLKKKQNVRIISKWYPSIVSLLDHGVHLNRTVKKGEIMVTYVMEFHDDTTITLNIEQQEMM